MATDDRSEGIESTPYSQDGGEHSGFSTEASPPPKKGKMGNLVLAGAAVIFVGFVGVVGYKMLGQQAAPPAPAPISQSAPQVDQELATTPDPMGSMMEPIADPSVDPIDPAASGLNPMTGLPVMDEVLPEQPPVSAPDAGFPVASADPIQQPVDITPVAPVEFANQPTPVEVVQAQPVVSAPEVVAVPTQSVIAPVAAGSMDQLRTDILGALDRFQQTVSAMDQRLTSRVDGLAGDIKSMQERLTALENNRSVTPAARPAAKPAAAPARRATPRPAAKPQPRPAPRTNRIEIIERADVPAPRVVAVPVQVSAEAGCKVASIQPGRFWLRRADGSFATYGEGDRLGNGRVTKVDPDSGVHVDGRRWNCGS